MMRLRDGFELAILGMVLVSCVQASLSYECRIKNIGRIVSIGVAFYSDAGCTVEVNEINWGSLPRGGYSSTTLYAKNTGTEPAPHRS